MKRQSTLLAVSLFLLLSFQILPQETVLPNSSKMEACFETLQLGLKSENLGVQAGCAYMAGEVSCRRSVVCLMKLLHNSSSEELRILAALSLYKLRDSRGIYAIKQAIRFDESERVSRICENFYRAYLKESNDAEIQVVTK
jgi:HEAT repeat protein